MDEESSCVSNESTPHAAPPPYKGIDHILDTVQRRPSARKSCEEKIKELLRQVGPDVIWSGQPAGGRNGTPIRGLNHLINYLMNKKEIKEEAVNRLIGFLAIVANFEEFAQGDKQPLFTRTFDKAISFCEDVCPVRRLRAAQLVVRLIRKLQNEDWLTDEQFDALAKLSGHLVIDKIPSIRCEGVRILAKLQDPHDPNCSHMYKIMFHMAKDPKPEVRRTCVEVIALTTRSLSKIQLRSMDVSTSVRKQVYMVYAKKIKLRVLQLVDRTHILARGFADRSPAVVQVVTDELLPAWLSQCNGSLPTLLDNLDPYHKPGTTLKVINVLLERAYKEERIEQVVNEFVEKHMPAIKPTSNTSSSVAAGQTNNATISLLSVSTVDATARTETGDASRVGQATPAPQTPLREDQMTATSLMFWRGLCIFLKSHSEDALCHALLFKVLPETGRLADLMIRTVGRSESNLDPDGGALAVVTHRLVCSQLILLLGHADFSDFSGKSRLNDAIKTCLAQPHMEHFFEPLVSLLCILHGSNSDEVVPEVVDVISEIESPLMNAQDRQALLSRSICGDNTEGTDGEAMDVDDEEARPGANKSKNGPQKVIDEPLHIVQTRVQLTLLREKIETLVQEQQFLEAQKAKDEMGKLQAVISEFEEERKRQEKDFLSKDDELENSFEAGLDNRHADDHFKEMELDPQSARRCLAIMALSLQKATPKRLDTLLETFIEQRALKAICLPVYRTRMEAVRCLVLGCILSKRFAKTKIRILTQIAKTDVEEIRVVALRGIFDILLRYGIKAFSSVEEDPSMLSVSRIDVNRTSGGEEGDSAQQEMQKIILFLVDFLKVREERLLEVAIEGLCKLMFVGHLKSPRILAHLLSFWFNVNYAGNSNIIHSLSLFFEAYPRLSLERLDCVREAFFSCLRLFLEANDTSTLASVPIERVVDTIVSLCDARCMAADRCHNATNLPTPHDHLAEELLNKMIGDPFSPELKYYCRAMTKLSISPNADVRALLRLCRKLQRKIDSPLHKRQVSKFEESLRRLVDDGENNNDGDRSTLVNGSADERADTEEMNRSAEKSEATSESDRGTGNTTSSKSRGAAPAQNTAAEESSDDEAAPAHDIALRKRLERKSAPRDTVFSDSD